MPVNLGAIALGMVKQLEKRVKILEEASQQVRREDIQQTETSEGETSI